MPLVLALRVAVQPAIGLRFATHWWRACEQPFLPSLGAAADGSFAVSLGARLRQRRQ